MRALASAKVFLWAGRSSHQPLFLGGAGQFLEHIRAEVFPDERILVEQSKAADLTPPRCHPSATATLIRRITFSRIRCSLNSA